MFEFLIHTFWKVRHLASGRSDDATTYSEALYLLRRFLAEVPPEDKRHRICRQNIEQLIKQLGDEYEPYLEDDYKKGNWFMDRPMEQSNPDNFQPAPPKKSRVRLDQPIVKQMGDILFTIRGDRPDEDELAAKSVWWIDGKDIIVTTDFRYDDGEKIVFSISPNGLDPSNIGPYVETMRGETG